MAEAITAAELHPIRHAVFRFLGIVLGLSVTFAGLGATVAFSYYVYLGIPMLALGLGILSAAIES